MSLAARLHATSHLEGTFRLRSGSESDHYFDKYRFESDPGLLRDVCAAMEPLVPHDAEALAGLELGGVPIATVLGQRTGLPVVFVRKEAKTYGTCRLAEGLEVSGVRLTVIEDVVTSAGQLVASIGDLRGEGAIVDTALCAIDREDGGAGRLRGLGVELRPLFRARDFDGVEPVVVGDIEVTASPSFADREVLSSRLYEFNAETTGITDGEWLAAFMRNDRGDIVAGLVGSTWGGCCKISEVWVHRELRGQGFGVGLLVAAEEEARRRGCHQIVLSSHSFQAPALYRRLGFEEFAVVDEDPRGHQEVYLRKALEHSGEGG